MWASRLIEGITRSRLQLGLLALLWTSPLMGAEALSLGDESLRDPTQPFSFGAAGVANVEVGSRLGMEDFRLSSILMRENLRLAVINGQRVREGENVNGADVREISSSRVRLDAGGEEFVLHLYDQSIKTLSERDE